MNANAGLSKHLAKLNLQCKEAEKKIRLLEKELSRKDKALAETAALLVLRKKVNAIWGEGEDE